MTLSPRISRIFHIRWATLLFLVPLSVPACSAQQDEQAASERPTQVGDELSLCADCPVFVRVPSLDATARPIRYVSKFELTWRNYLSSYNDGRCDLPRYANMAGEHDLTVIRENIDQFGIDWPIAQLGPAEVQCYITWLQEKTNLTVALPTGAEWEWFARAGQPDARYPWGNSPTDGAEPLFGVSAIFSRIPDGPVSREHGGEYVKGIRVGQSTPNPWGLHDLMGNVTELTNETISGEEWFRRHPDPTVTGRARTFPLTLVKGSTASNQDWSRLSISDVHYVNIVDGRYLSPVGVRLVLIERKK